MWWSIDVGRPRNDWKNSHARESRDSQIVENGSGVRAYILVDIYGRGSAIVRKQRVLAAKTLWALSLYFTLQ